MDLIFLLKSTIVILFLKFKKYVFLNFIYSLHHLSNFEYFSFKFNFEVFEYK